MRPRAIIHIGGEKTGSKSIQAFCALNRLALANRGILYPNTLGRSNHLRLEAYAANDDVIDDIRLLLGIRTADDLARFRFGLEQNLANEIARVPNLSLLLISNELLQSRLLHLSEIERLRQFVGHFSADSRVLVYLRRQDRLAVSYYSTRLKVHIDDANEVFPSSTQDPAVATYYDYDAMLRRYESVFGREKITVRIFEPERLLNGDLLEDFRFHVGIPECSGLLPSPRENESLSPIGIEFYRRFNKTVPRFVDGELNEMRAGINEAMMSDFAGRGPRVERKAAREFYNKFREGNRAIKGRYFPDQPGELFDEDFSTYRRDRVQDDELRSPYDVAVHLWLQRSRQIRNLKAENSLLKYLASGKDKLTENPPMIPELGENVTLPDFLFMRYVGALLSAEETGRAVKVLGEDPSKPALAFALGFALLRLGNIAGFEALLQRRSEQPGLRASLLSLRQSGVAQQERAKWWAWLKAGAPLQVQMYQKCLAWLEE